MARMTEEGFGYGGSLAAPARLFLLLGLPTTTIADAEGRVLRTMWGLPTISEVRRLLGALD